MSTLSRLDRSSGACVGRLQGSVDFLERTMLRIAISELLHSTLALVGIHRPESGLDRLSVTAIGMHPPAEWMSYQRISEPDCLGDTTRRATGFDGHARGVSRHRFTSNRFLHFERMSPKELPRHVRARAFSSM